MTYGSYIKKIIYQSYTQFYVINQNTLFHSFKFVQNISKKKQLFLSVPAAASRKYYKGPFQAVRDIAKTSGLRGLYRGFRTQFVRDTPAASLYMMSYTFFQYEAQLRQDMIPSQVITNTLLILTFKLIILQFKGMN